MLQLFCRYCIIIYLFIYLFTYLFIYLFTYLFIYLFTYLLIYLFTYLLIYLFIYLFIFTGSAAQREIWAPRTTRFLDHTQRRTTVARTPPEV
jgi:hypothetical protein